MAKAFFGGIPTSIDVRKLREAFPSLREGDEITHEQVEAVIGSERHASRYRTVTSAWRRELLRNDGIEIGAVIGIGFRCLTPPERIDSSVAGVKAGARKQIRAVRRAEFVKTNDPVLVRKQGILRRLGVAVMQEMTSMAHQIEPPKASPQLPRLVPKAKGRA